MKITVISDLHGELPETKGGDLLLLCGDYTGSNKTVQWVNFFEWVKKQDYRKKILIAGNHDGWLYDAYPQSEEEKKGLKEVQSLLSVEDLEDGDEFTYLCDEGIDFEGVKIWGSPWSLSFKECNPHCRYFMKTENELETPWALISPDTEILITHCPPYSRLDRNRFGMPCGSLGLLDRICYDPVKKPDSDTKTTLYINASLLDEDYEPVNKPVNLILEGTPGCRTVEILKD
jgi:Icc-related predicted phosphoesterase